MSTIRIFSKKAFAIGVGATKNSDVIEQFITVPGTFQDMPEALMKDKMFKMAVAAHEIEIINKVVQVPVEPVNNPVNPVNDEEFEESNDDSEKKSVDEKIEQFKEDLKAMNKDAVREAAKKYGAEFIDTDPLKTNKKKVFEAYKIYLNDNND